MHRFFTSSVVTLGAVLGIAMAGTAVATAGSPAPARVEASNASLPTCLSDTTYPSDTCAITALTDHSVSMTWTVNPAYPYCTIGGSDPCDYDLTTAFNMELIGGTTFQIAGSCPDAASNGTFTTGSDDINLANADPLSCSATWTWDGATEDATQAYLTMDGVDGQGQIQNEYHSFGVNLPPPGPNAAFTSVAGSDPGAYTFTDTSYSVVPQVGITGEAWTSSDGGDGTGKTWDHTFDTDGTYDVTLEVTDSNGNTASVTHPVKVTTVGSGGSSASIEVKEKLSPAHDAGRFDLQVGAKQVTTKAANGDHGVAHVAAGSYLVRQLARTVALTHYGVSLGCTKNGHKDLRASASAGTVKVAAGDSVVCTFTDKRTAATHCDVPVLTGKSKVAANKALAKAHCRLGAVHTAAKAGASPVVTASSPGAYAVRKKNAKVAITLGKK